MNKTENKEKREKKWSRSLPGRTARGAVQHHSPTMAQIAAHKPAQQTTVPHRKISSRERVVLISFLRMEDSTEPCLASPRRGSSSASEGMTRHDLRTIKAERWSLARILSLSAQFPPQIETLACRTSTIAVDGGHP
jgi:hypothetical protein